MSPKSAVRERLTTVILTVLLGAGLVLAGLAVGVVLLWLVGPVLTVLLCLVTVGVYLAVRAAMRARRVN